MMPHDKRNNGPSDSPGILGQMSRLRAHSGATAAELRQFVQSLRGRSPQEVIGVLAQSNLVRATSLAAVGTLVLMIVFTLLPAVFADKPAPVEKPTPVAAPAAPPPKTEDNKAAAKDGEATPDKTAKKDKADPLEKLGINETKTADPKKNPLDNTGDDLFKDVK